jgi:hypothetical protein
MGSPLWQLKICFADRAQPPAKSEVRKHIFRLVVQLAVDPGDFLAPALAVPVGQCQNVVMGPMQVIGDESRFFIDFIRRIYFYAPAS